jgi:hypothetical protein
MKSKGRDETLCRLRVHVYRTFTTYYVQLDVILCLVVEFAVEG